MSDSAIDFDTVQANLVTAISLQQSGDLEGAEHGFLNVLALCPAHPAAAYSLGVIALRRNDHVQARHWAKVGLMAHSNYAPLFFLAAAGLRAAGGATATILEFFDRAIALQPDYVEALVNSGVVLREVLRHKEALARFNRVLEIDPTHQTALSNMGILLTEFKQSESAIAMFQRLVREHPDADYASGLLLFERLHICDWTDYDAQVTAIIHACQQGKRSCKSLPMMAISDQASDTLQAAKIFAEHLYGSDGGQLWRGPRAVHEKIRLAYISPDLREHPVGHLMVGVIEQHDKARFELTAISLGIDDKSRIRGRMLGAFDRFVDASRLNSQQIAQLIRSLEIDVLVDLGAFTADSRPDVLAQRPAPIQVNYLGYAGSMGVDYMDYIIADRQVIPPHHWPHYVEKVVYLPDDYMPTDNRIEIPEPPPRSTYGLPDDALVFCAFNHDFKITPHIYAIWMRLLVKHPRSVLWMISRNETAQRNLRAHAVSHGVDPERLIFAKRVPRVEDHLARYRLVDLFLDTYPYNAHTTAADALMAGCPVVTCMGEAFHARVAGSHLQAVGMAELATHSLAEYEALADALASDPERLAAIKTRLRAARATSPLFDTPRFCRNLESAYIAMWRTHSLGETGDEL